MCWSPDGRYLASADTEDSLYLWDAKAGEPLAVITLPYRTVRDLHWSAAAHDLTVTFNNGAVTTWRLPPDQPTSTEPTADDNDRVLTPEQRQRYGLPTMDSDYPPTS
jgi:WD40 repeat protein